MVSSVRHWKCSRSHFHPSQHPSGIWAGAPCTFSQLAFKDWFPLQFESVASWPHPSLISHVLAEPPAWKNIKFQSRSSSSQCHVKRTKSMSASQGHSAPTARAPSWKPMVGGSPTLHFTLSTPWVQLWRTNQKKKKKNPRRHSFKARFQKASS